MKQPSHTNPQIHKLPKMYKMENLKKIKKHYIEKEKINISFIWNSTATKFHEKTSWMVLGEK